MLGSILARIPLEKYSAEEKRQLEQRIELYLYNMFDDEDETGIEFNYPPDTPPFVPNIKGIKRRYPHKDFCGNLFILNKFRKFLFVAKRINSGTIFLLNFRRFVSWTNT